MKISFQTSLIGFIMLTIFLLGVVVSAQKGGPTTQKTCVEAYPNNTGKCDAKQCSAECTKKRPKGILDTYTTSSIEDHHLFYIHKHCFLHNRDHCFSITTTSPHIHHDHRQEICNIFLYFGFTASFYVTATNSFISTSTATIVTTTAGRLSVSASAKLNFINATSIMPDRGRPSHRTLGFILSLRSIATSDLHLHHRNALNARFSSARRCISEYKKARLRNSSWGFFRWFKVNGCFNLNKSYGSLAVLGRRSSGIISEAHKLQRPPQSTKPSIRIREDQDFEEYDVS
ncbi:hypothetical protein YC2023_075512 [Brassica napus]